LCFVFQYILKLKKLWLMCKTDVSLLVRYALRTNPVSAFLLLQIDFLLYFVNIFYRNTNIFSVVVSTWKLEYLLCIFMCTGIGGI